jgi:hypothetical protein
MTLPELRQRVEMRLKCKVERARIELGRWLGLEALGGMWVKASERAQGALDAASEAMQYARAQESGLCEHAERVKALAKRVEAVAATVEKNGKQDERADNAAAARINALESRIEALERMTKPEARA